MYQESQDAVEEAPKCPLKVFIKAVTLFSLRSLLPAEFWRQRTGVA